MPADRLLLRLIRLAGLVEDLVADRELADVMQETGPAQPAAMLQIEAELLGDLSA